MSTMDFFKKDMPDLTEFGDEEKSRYKDIPLCYRKNISDCVKIEHYSWHEESPFRYLDKKLMNEYLLRSAELAVENEFLRWDNETSKRIMLKNLGMIRNDENIPQHSAWHDDSDFNNAAIETLKALIKENESSEITDTVRIAERRLQEAEQKGDTRLAQIFERILYELNECSLKEFYALKRAVANGK